jgi:hypothetical protein
VGRVLTRDRRLDEAIGPADLAGAADGA